MGRAQKHALENLTKGEHTMTKTIEEYRKNLPASDTGDGNFFDCAIVHPKVLMPGCPDRVRIMAAQWDEGAQVWPRERGYAVASGTYRGAPITAVSHGIGGGSLENPFMAILPHGVDALIRVGSTGGLRADIKVGDLIINDSNVRLDSTSSMFVRNGYPSAGALPRAQAGAKPFARRRRVRNGPPSRIAPGGAFPRIAGSFSARPRMPHPTKPSNSKQKQAGTRPVLHWKKRCRPEDPRAPKQPVSRRVIRALLTRPRLGMPADGALSAKLAPKNKLGRHAEERDGQKLQYNQNNF